MAKEPCRITPDLERFEEHVRSHTDAPLRGHIYLRLETTPDRLFEAVTAADEMPKWLPGLTAVRYDHEGSATPGTLGTGSRRSLIFGRTPDQETVVEMRPDRLFSYRIDQGPPVKDHLATMGMAVHPDGGSMFYWGQYFRIRKLSLGGVAMPAAVGSMLSKSADNLVAKFGGEDLSHCLP